MMKMTAGKWIRIRFNKITQSIAFYPALIAIGFLFLSWGMLVIDFSVWGKHLKLQLSWLSLKDASTARSIISTVAGAIISLTVFSFSMVMIVLNQAASQMSNRVLSSMIENRFQQVTLGFYIGTIVYALFLLSTIRDINSGVYVPALSIYLLILLTVIDIFLFIYFLDYVTQTVKYETVIQRVQSQTMQSMCSMFIDSEEVITDRGELTGVEIKTTSAGYFQGFNLKQVLSIARKENVYISFTQKAGTFLIKGNTCMVVYGHHEITDDLYDKLLSATEFFKGQPIERNADYGFHQLAEIAIKALSPGINDPATAVISLHALTDLLSFRATHYMPCVFYDTMGKPRVTTQNSTFEDLFKKCIYPIWNYGKKDQYIQQELVDMLKQLKTMKPANEQCDMLFTDLMNTIRKEQAISQ